MTGSDALLREARARVAALPWNPVELPDGCGPEWAVSEYRDAVLAALDVTRSVEVNGSDALLREARAQIAGTIVTIPPEPGRDVASWNAALHAAAEVALRAALDVTPEPLDSDAFRNAVEADIAAMKSVDREEKP